MTRSPGHDVTPAWSPDGRTITYSHEGEIWLIGAEGSDPRPLVRKIHPYDDDVSPTWHGPAVVYASNRAGFFNQELFRVPATRLTFTKGSDSVLGDDGQPDAPPVAAGELHHRHDRQPVNPPTARQLGIPLHGRRGRPHRRQR